MRRFFSGGKFGGTSALNWKSRETYFRTDNILPLEEVGARVVYNRLNTFASSTSFVVPLPLPQFDSIKTIGNKVRVVIIAYGPNTTGSPNTPAGWTEIGTGSGNGGGSCDAYYKDYSGTETDTSVTITRSVANEMTFNVIAFTEFDEMIAPVGWGTTSGGTGSLTLNYDTTSGFNGTLYVGSNAQYKTIASFLGVNSSASTLVSFERVQTNNVDNTVVSSIVGTSHVAHSAITYNCTSEAASGSSFLVTVNGAATDSTTYYVQVAGVANGRQKYQQSATASTTAIQSQVVEHNTAQGYPVLRTTVDGGSNSAATATVTFPTGHTTNDLLIIVIHWDLETAAPTTPAGWTQLGTLNTAVNDTFNTTAFYKVDSGSEGASVVISNASTVARRMAWVSLCVQAGTYTGVPEIATLTQTNTSNPTNPAITPSWGLYKNLTILTAGRQDVATTFESPIGIDDSGATQNNSSANLSWATKKTYYSTLTPSVWIDNSSTSDDYNLFTIAVQGYVVASGTTLSPSLFTNTNSFFTHSIRRTLTPSAYTDGETFFSLSLRRTMRPTNYVDSDTFYTQSIRRIMRPALYTDPDGFFTHSIRRTVRPSLYTDPDTINAHRLSVPIRPSLFTNTNSFFTHSIRRVLRPTNYVDSDTFYTQSVRITLRPSLYTDSDTFYTQSIRRILRPSLFVDGDTFYTHAISIASGNIQPSLYTNTQSFFTHSIRRTVRPSLYSDGETFFSLSLRRTIRPTNYVDGDTFYSQSIRRTLRPNAYSDPDTFYTQVIRRVVFAALHSNSQTFFGPRINRIMRPTLYTDADTFYAHSLRRTLKPAAFSNSNTFYTHSIGLGVILINPNLFVNSNQFYSSRIGVRLGPSLFTNSAIQYTHNVYVDVGQIWIEEANPAAPVWAEVANSSASWTEVSNPATVSWPEINNPASSGWTEIPNGNIVSWEEED